MTHRLTSIHVDPRITAALLLLLLSTQSLDVRSSAYAADSPPVDDDFFERKIRPVLVAECYGCHSAEASRAGKLKGELAVDTRESLLRGGESGPAVVPGQVEKSLLIAAIKHETFQMPPSKRLPAHVVADFERWVAGGAPDPRHSVTPPLDGSPRTTSPTINIEQARREHWAFQPLSTRSLPAVSDTTWSRTGIDHFILAKLEHAGLRPSPPAAPAVLLRRVYLDLIGLPPSIDEIEEYLAGHVTYEEMVERLLASPHYGERWGRHWLDLARYADSSGFHNDLDRPNAWRYRDYVIQSLNQDKSYSRFVSEQLAGDELDDVTDESLIATGFNTHGPSNADNVGKNDRDREQYRLDQLDDVVSTSAVVFCGLTLGCARCHDHKIDPITSEDYYRWLAIFNGGEVQGGPLTKTPKKGEEGVLPTIQAFVETTAEVRPTFLLRRGNVELRGPEVEPAAPQVLTTAPLEILKPGPMARSSGRRRAFAAWLTSRQNPLAYRVLANRVWQHHFGRGLVATPNNFGFGGERPTHPELLDYLAARLVKDEGRLKQLHRWIVTSSVYRQSGAVSTKLMLDEENARIAATAGEPGELDKRRRVDPENRLLWHMPTRRLDAETLRDSMLAASGSLNRQLFGPGVKPRIRPELLDASQRNKWPTLERDGPAQWRRSVYIYVKRQLLMPMMELFDSPTTTTSVGERGQSVVPTQALLMMNDEFIEQQAENLVDHCSRAKPSGSSAIVASMMMAAWSSPPAPSRVQEAHDFVRQRVEAYQAEGVLDDDADRQALIDLAHVLLNSSDFVYVE